MSCETCKYTNEDGNGTHCRGCIHNAEDHYKPITNAGRIRNMTDEELADLLEKIALHTCTVLDCIQKEEKKGHITYCEECFLEWLQAEVKEGAENE